MIHLSKSKKTGQFIVIVTGDNGEKLSTSELLKTKQSAWKNIRAQIGQMNSPDAVVQDNTKRKPEVVRCFTYNKAFTSTMFKCVEAPQVK